MKRFLNALLAFVLFVSLSAPTSFAQSSLEDTLAMVEKANAKIEACVYDAQVKAEGADSEKVAKIIEKLVEKTNGIAEQTSEKAAKDGYSVEFGYTTYVIGGIEVEIDPMTVH